jgi:hypothetical protein
MWQRRGSKRGWGGRKAHHPIVLSVALCAPGCSFVQGQNDESSKDDSDSSGDGQIGGAFSIFDPQTSGGDGSGASSGSGGTGANTGGAGASGTAGSGGNPGSGGVPGDDLCDAGVWDGGTPEVLSLSGNTFAHDPTMIEADGVFYRFWTGNDIPSATSTNLSSWSNAPAVYQSG